MNKLESPWFVKILLGFSGWLAALFLLLFMGLFFSFVFEQSLLTSILGFIFLTVAYFLLRENSNKEFLDNLAFVFSLAGQGLIFFAITDVLQDFERLSMLLIICIQIVLFFLIPHFIHRIFAVTSAAVTFLILTSSYHLEFFASSFLLAIFMFLNLHEFNYIQYRKRIHAAIYGLIFAIIPFYISMRYGFSREFYLNDLSNPELLATIGYWGGEIVLVLTLLYCVIHLLKRLNIDFKSTISLIVIIATLIFCFLGSHAAGVILSMIILICGFANSNRILRGIAICSLLFFTSQYYYSLNITLLEKSRHLFVLGLSMLLIPYLSSYLLNGKTTQGVTTNA